MATNYYDEITNAQKVAQATSPAANLTSTTSGDAKSLIEKMNQNSAAWHDTTDTAAQQNLHGDNISIGEELNKLGYVAAYDQDNGQWTIGQSGDPLANWEAKQAAKKANQPMTYEQAYAYAKKLLANQSALAGETAANTASQNLDKMGVYDSLYGQSLLANAQQDAVNNVDQQAVSLAYQLLTNSQNDYWNQQNYGLSQQELAQSAQQLQTSAQSQSVQDDYYKALTAAQLAALEEESNPTAARTVYYTTDNDEPKQIGASADEIAAYKDYIARYRTIDGQKGVIKQLLEGTEDENGNKKPYISNEQAVELTSFFNLD